jgi:hypothetical protein
MFKMISKEEIMMVSGAVLSEQVVCQCKIANGDITATTLLQSYGDECEYGCCHNDPSVSYRVRKVKDILDFSKKDESEIVWNSCITYSAAEHRQRHMLPI